MRTVTVSGKQFRLNERAIQRAVAGQLPEPARDHFVVVAGRRWPPKQVLALATGLDRADFTTHQARGILTRLGFPAGRIGQTSARRSAGGAAGASTARRSGTRRGPRLRSATEPVAEPAAEPVPLVEALRPFVGEWVAVRGDDVLVAASAPRHVVAWLTEHGQQADSVFRVPDSEQSIGGAAPL